MKPKMMNIMQNTFCVYRRSSCLHYLKSKFKNCKCLHCTNEKGLSHLVKANPCLFLIIPQSGLKKGYNEAAFFLFCFFLFRSVRPAAKLKILKTKFWTFMCILLKHSQCRDRVSIFFSHLHNTELYLYEDTFCKTPSLVCPITLNVDIGLNPPSGL